jgi:acetamidase/formamidase
LTPSPADDFGRDSDLHLLTGPVKIEYAEPGDVLEVRILDVFLRPSTNPGYEGQSFGVNVAGLLGSLALDGIDDPKPRKLVTVYGLEATGNEGRATALFNYIATTQGEPSDNNQDPYHFRADVPEASRNFGILEDIHIPARLNFGAMGLAQAEVDPSSPPLNYAGGNVDDWRIGKGAKMYYPVAVRGAFFSVGNPHAAHGDSEIYGAAIETSLTGVFQFILHKAANLPGTLLEGLDAPLLETDDEWAVHGFSFEISAAASSNDRQVAATAQSSIDLAMLDAYRRMRRFLMRMAPLTEDEADSLLAVAVDLDLARAVSSHWTVHASLKKGLFAERQRKGITAAFSHDFHPFPLVGINGDDAIQ